ncbi:MAG: MoaD/ThiS family protein [Phycisphaeraceae bacterium]|nr:MAG: MoaD/ThiS family protein [Phycisphaeraceae bacterium]
MKVEVLIFGGAALVTKTDRVTVEVGPAPTVRDVLLALHAQHPSLRFALPPPETGRLAVNQAFAKGDDPIKPGPVDRGGDEVALVTLVGGG